MRGQRSRCIIEKITVLLARGFIAGSDGLFYGYAKWPSAERRAKAFEIGEEHPARPAMVEAIEESFPEVLLEVAADHLIDRSES